MPVTLPTHALTRRPSVSLERGERTYVGRAPIAPALAAAQHARYRDTLSALGLTVIDLPPLEGYPDAAFVEDVAVMLTSVALITRPGAPSRRGEIDSVEHALSKHVQVRALRPPSALDGGDVLRVGDTLYVGRTGRSNDHGIAELAEHAAAQGLRVHAVAVRGCLHLKTACTLAAEGVLVANPEWVELGSIDVDRVVEVAPDEPFAANVLWLRGRAVSADSGPRTRSRLEAAGIEVVPLPLSELEKAEAGPTCLSVTFATAPG